MKNNRIVRALKVGVVLLVCCVLLNGCSNPNQVTKDEVVALQSQISALTNAIDDLRIEATQNQIGFSGTELDNIDSWLSSSRLTIARLNSRVDSFKVIQEKHLLSSDAHSLQEQAEADDDNPIIDYTATGLPIHEGPRGGHYHWSKNGNKEYEKK